MIETHGEQDPGALRDRIDAGSHELVALARQAVAGAASLDLAPGQIELLMGQAQGGYGPAHLVNWLRYQCGRSGEAKAWETSGLAALIIADIDTLRQSAEAIAESLTWADAEQRHEQAWLALVRRYLAYFARAYRIVWARDSKGGTTNET